MQSIFKDKDGNVVIGQKPNAPILTWITLKLILLFKLPIIVEGLLSLIAFGALFTWAWLEIFSGVNTFRKALGIVVMILLLAHSLT